jgi:tRNA-splicing ligase RtcB
VDLSRLTRRSEFEWVIEPRGKMRVPGVLLASEALVRAMDDKVLEQVSNVATLPGIRQASLAMPDAHWGYGFAVGGVAAFDPEEGVISAGGVGFDISCGRTSSRGRGTSPTRSSARSRREWAAAGAFGCRPRR